MSVISNSQEGQFSLCCTKHLKRPSAVFLSFNIHDICQIFHASIFPIYYYLPDKKKIICDISSPEYGIVCICINSLGMICQFSSLNNPFLHNPLLAWLKIPPKMKSCCRILSQWNWFHTSAASDRYHLWVSGL